MAIGNIYVTNDDHFAKGGVRSMVVCANGDAGATNAVSSSASNLVATGVIGAAANLVYLDFEKESAKMTVSSTKTDALTLYTITIEGYLPAISGEYLARMHEYAKQDGLRAQVYLWEFHNDSTATEAGRPFLVGWDNILAESATHTDFPLVLESIEFDSGSALQDQNGATVKFSCVQALPPGQWA
tara:strand:+ start:119 stop:673 length:555 start_codon:yes stop_codon:yes gene_type:complete